jgi:hypothetical protein
MIWVSFKIRQYTIILLSVWGRLGIYQSPMMLKSLIYNGVVFVYNPHTSSHILQIISVLLTISNTKPTPQYL